MDEFGERGAVHAFAGLDGGDAEGGGEMALAGPRGAEEVDDLGALDKVELSEREDAVSVQGRLEGEVEAFDGFGRVEPGGGQRDADAAAFAEAEFVGEQGVDGVERTDFPAFDALDDVAQRLGGARHFQADEVLMDPVDQRGHGLSPGAARRRATLA